MTTETLAVSSFIRGYHEYMEIWEPKIDDKYPLKWEEENKEDANAVAVARKREAPIQLRRVRYTRRTKKRPSHPNEMNGDFEVIGHLPKLMAVLVTKFLKRATNSGHAVVMGKWINRGGGYGLEDPCEFQFTGDGFSINWLRTKLNTEGYHAK